MNIWRNRQSHEQPPAPTPPLYLERRQAPGEKRVPMRQSEPIEVDGVFLGAAVEHELGVRFIAVDTRVTDMDQSIWPTLEFARRSARQLFKSGVTAPSRHLVGWDAAP